MASHGSTVSPLHPKNQFFQRDLGILVLSIAIQVVLGVLFGHLYDMRIFMATGYLVGTGQNPYISQDLSAVFHNLTFQNITTVGYPPPWPLVLGLIYRVVYTAIPNFLVYNLALKIPIIAANIGLAYLVSGVIRKINPNSKAARKAWLFMLLNPFMLYATAAWGQFDSIVALLALYSLVLFDTGKIKFSAILLAMAISFKPIALPLVLIPLFYLKLDSIRQTLNYYGVLIISGVLFCIVPFIVFGWDPSPILQNWNAHVIVGGGMSFLVFLELTRNSYQLVPAWWFLGMLWIPALAVTSFFIGRSTGGLKNLLIKSTALIMVLFLTRAWLSEPNIILVLPFIVILTSVDEFDRFTLAAIWILPLVFSFFNTAFAQLFFPSLPAVMEKLVALAEEFRKFRLISKIIIVIPWQIVGWRVVFRCLIKTPASHSETLNVAYSGEGDRNQR
ncbi:hypothetical protein LARV_03585 [Longilinea arvoryzae]|uniref:DUF2029 domain-containing protein n=1 Tax=Longilinea arvoryzae TaxID=360412 RepID=A0A0S7BPB7_9CHLR|nr:hypothetical protein [Longilinea arvoryzae]GAP15793.1 hypothetical protein LARV_03585 [Longilinea arvoryzae]